MKFMKFWNFWGGAVCGVLVSGVVFATAWVILITYHPPAASKASPQASSASDRAIASPPRIDSSGLEKVHGSPQEALPNTRQSAINPSATLPNVQGSGRSLDPTAWIRELPEEKRRQVENAFDEHAACVKERARSSTTGEQDKQIDLEKIQRIMEDCDHGLKSTLRTVLSGEEYNGFLSSLPPAPSAGLTVPPASIPQK